MFIASVLWNWEEMPSGVELYSETFSDAIKNLDSILKDASSFATKSIEIFEAEGKNSPRKLIASMRTIK